MIPIKYRFLSIGKRFQIVKRRFSFIGLIAIAFIALQLFNGPSIGQTLVFVPAQDYEGTFISGANNDIFVEVDPISQIVNPDIWSATSDFDLFVSDDELGTPLGVFSQNSPFDLVRVVDTTNLLQFKNVTNANLEVSYAGTIYDLTTYDNKAQKEVTGVIIEDDKFYGFSFDGVMMEPMAISLNVNSASAIKVDIINPNGTTYTNTFSLAEERTGFLPFVPMVTGPHDVIFTPFQDLVIDSMSMLSNFPIEDLSESMSSSIQARGSKLKFYRYIPSEPSEDETSLDQAVLEIRVDRSLPSFYVSSGYRVFSNLTTSIFGSSHPIHYGDEVLIAVYTLEPDKDSRDFHNHIYGTEVSMDYDIIINRHDLPNLPVNEAFLSTPQGIEISKNYYYYSPSSPTALGVNSSTFQSLTFTDLNTMNQITLSTNDRDLLNDQTNSLSIFTGQYLVEVTSSSLLRITEAEILQGPTKFSNQLGEVKVVHFLVDRFETGLFELNLTTTNDVDVDLDVSVYDSEGEFRFMTKVTFSENEATMEFDTGFFNLESAYLRLQHTGNNIYHKLNGSLFESNVPDLKTTFSIDMLNQTDRNVEENTVLRYYVETIEGGDSISLEVSSSLNQQMYHTLRLERGAYVLSMAYLGSTLLELAFYNAAGNRIFPSGYTIIGSTLLYEFVISQATTIGVFMAFNPSLQSLTFDMALTILQVQHFLQLSFGLFPTSPQKPDTNSFLVLQTSMILVSISFVVLMYRRKRDY